MKQLAYALLVVGCLAINLASDVLLRDAHPGLAHDWDWVAGGVAGVGLFLLLASSRDGGGER